MLESLVPALRDSPATPGARERVASERVVVTRDQRTGLLNERALMVVGRSVLSFARRHDEPVSIVVVRLGEETKTSSNLLTVAQVLRVVVDDGDVAARTGDAELAVLLPDADAARAGEVTTEVIRRLTEGRDRPVEHLETGVATVWPQAARSMEQLLDAARQSAGAPSAPPRPRRPWAWVRDSLVARHLPGRSRASSSTQGPASDASSSGGHGPMF